MRASGGEYDPKEIKALGSLVQKYLEKNAGKDPAKARQAVEQLLREISASGMEATPESMGVVVGALTAGMMKHFDQIKADAETRNKWVSAISDVLGGAANALPGPWSAVAGVALGVLKNVYAAVDNPQDNSAVAREFKGAFKLKLLQHPPAGWDPVKVGTTIDWIETTLDTNGVK